MGIDILHPRLSWQLKSTENEIMQTAYELRVAISATSYDQARITWSTGKVFSSQSVNFIYNGPPLSSMQRIYWQVRVWDNHDKASRWSEVAWWEMGFLNPSDWKASWITFTGMEEEKHSKPAQYYRKEFGVDKEVKSARVYATSLGLYELRLNGEKISPDLFTPGWTSYTKRLQYQTYDVSHLLREKNAIGMVLTDGWYRGKIGWNREWEYYGSQLAMLVHMQINYTDGTSETIGSDQSWKVSNRGPIIESDIYHGEKYDARLELTGWDQPGYKSDAWNNVSLLNHSKDILIASRGESVKAIQEIHPVKIFVTPKGETVFDMGQNMVGWVRLKVSGNKGAQVTLKFAEVLDNEGNFYTGNLRYAKATDEYILKGEGIEVFEPHSTFHGFRYVKAEGLDQPITPDQITGIVIHSDMKPTGTFVCSDTLINQLQHNIVWGQKGNFLDVPTDCPQRDERLGWTGDAQVFCRTAAFNFDVAAFYTKWLGDLTADQLADGKVPNVIPDVMDGEGGSTAWADACIIVPWTLYLSYGDTRILEEQYPAMQSWVAYMTGRAGNDYLWTGDYHFGDWLAFSTNEGDYPGATTEKDLIANAYYFHATMLLSKIAAILGKEEDILKYQTLAVEIKKAFNLEFVTPNGRLVSHTQTAYALVLAFNLLPDNLVPRAADYFAGDVKKYGHLTTGFVGTPLLCKTLCSIGREDLAFMLLNNKQYPSWLYPVLQGATTIWERWDGIKPDGSFQDVSMNSFNHYAYGAIGEWLYQYVAGIDLDPQNPGYKHILLEPHPGGGLTFAHAGLQSVYGRIISSWRFEDGLFTYEVDIPANTTATISLPNATAEQVELNGKPFKYSYNQYKMKLQVQLGSGKYFFRYPFIL